MYGLSNGENISDLRWPLKVKGQGQTPKNWGTLLFQSTIDIHTQLHIQNPHENSGWSLAGCIGCCNVLSAATKLRRLALCAFIYYRDLPKLIESLICLVIAYYTIIFLHLYSALYSIHPLQRRFKTTVAYLGAIGPCPFGKIFVIIGKIWKT